MPVDLIHEPFTDEYHIAVLADEALSLLTELIATPSPSGNEHNTAELIDCYLRSYEVKTQRLNNNVWAYNQFYSADKPTILLNSHHDTVRPNEGYTRDPYHPEIADGKLYGLGSNDAGGCLVSLLAVFIYFYDRADMPYNLCLAATGEEENSGTNGLRSILPHIGQIAFAIVGEPTKMDLATAEMGNMVLDCTAYGVAGHAARNEGKNALYEALNDIQWFSTYRFPRQSAFLGEIKMTVTQINAGLQHNIIPHECHFTVDVRLSDCYSVTEVLEIIKNHTNCSISPRDGILSPSCIDHIHPVVRAGLALGCKTYTSPTSSDQGWLQGPSVKMGPGDSARSHMSDEFIYVNEVTEGVSKYVKLLKSMMYCVLHNPEADFIIK